LFSGKSGKIGKNDYIVFRTYNAGGKTIMQIKTVNWFPFGAPSVGRSDKKYPTEKENEKCKKID
jgi:hypothetical protein